MSDDPRSTAPPPDAARAPGRPARDAMWTLGELLAWTQNRFTEAGIEAARSDAQHLLAHALGCSRLSLYVRHDEVVGEDVKARFRELVRRRLKREPVAYIEGRRGVHAIDLELEGDPRVLIPRPETEHLVDWLLEELPFAPTPVRILDIGTGSGAIALAVAHHRPEAQVVASDRSPDALAVARANAERLAAAVTFVESDLLAALPVPERGFTAIAANLPYIRGEDVDGLQPEVSRFEPRMALDGGEDGLTVIRACIRQVAETAALAPEGALYLEVGYDQAADVCAELEAHGFVDVQTRA